MISLLDLSHDEMKELCTKLSQPEYRADQIYTALYSGCEISEITTLSKSLREELNTRFGPSFPLLYDSFVSEDGTEKFLFEMNDGEIIETVVMQYEHGNSVCISTQAGCAMGCGFCASTLKGKARDLTAGEMSAQVILAEKNSGRKISSIVMMGIGEPLDNYENSLKFIRNISHKKGKNTGVRHISLSTCGIVPRIKELAEESLGITLSVSLHAPNDNIRNRIMPVSRKYSIDSLLTACREYFDKTGRRISFEYSLISGVNDSPENAKELSSVLKKYFYPDAPFHVNLIPVNRVSERDYSSSNEKTVHLFYKTLKKQGINATVRRTLGGDIQASCGQLRYNKITGGE